MDASISVKISSTWEKGQLSERDPAALAGADKR
jgi:hypothetical protein